MLERIQEAKTSGLTLKLSYTTVALTGPSAVGKTSFLNLLNRKKFTRCYHSTNVAESKQVVYVNTAGVVGSGKKSQWIDLNHETMLEQLRKHLRTHTTYPMLFRLSKDASTQKHATKCQVENDIAENAASFNYDQTPTLGDVWRMVNFLDTGGQPEFINLFPAISSSIIVTFIVFNMHGGRKSLDEPVKVIHCKDGEESYKPYRLHYTNLELMKILMAFSKESSMKTRPPLPSTEQRSKNTSTSYQCYVGTHADKVSEAEIQSIECKLQYTATELKCTETLWELEEKVLFPVDNTTAGGENEDPIAGVIRTRIHKIAEDSSAYDVPITWLILLLEMQKICSQREINFLSFSEVAEICKVGNLSHNEKEIQNALLFFHLMGVLLYYHEVPGICQYVIINHQWLFEKLTNLVSLTFEREGFNFKAISQFRNEGLLMKSLIEQINLQANIKTDCFIALLEHLKVIAKIDAENYFMPCVLHSQSITSTILDQYGTLQHVQLLAHFVDNPLPRGFFCCLVVQICQNLPKNWILPLKSTKVKQHTYNNLISFHTSDTGHSVSLIDKIGYLEIQIRHKRTPPAIHYNVQQFLNCMFKEVCSHLQIDHKQLCYGFQCNCDDNETHVASLPKELESCPHWIQCPYSMMELTPSHLIWLQPLQEVVS